MKKILPLVLLMAVVGSGCSSAYRLTLNNGDTLICKGKPTYDPQQGRYYYKSIHGETNSISASRVREIGPVSRKDKEGPQFLTQ